MDLTRKAKLLRGATRRWLGFVDVIESFEVNIKDGKLMIYDPKGPGYGYIMSDPSSEIATIIYWISPERYIMGEHAHNIYTGRKPVFIPCKLWKWMSRKFVRPVETITVNTGKAYCYESGIKHFVNKENPMSIEAIIPHEVEFIPEEGGQFTSVITFFPKHRFHIVSNDGSREDFPLED